MMWGWGSKKKRKKRSQRRRGTFKRTIIVWCYKVFDAGWCFQKRVQEERTPRVYVMTHIHSPAEPLTPTPTPPPPFSAVPLVMSVPLIWPLPLCVCVSWWPSARSNTSHVQVELHWRSAASPSHFLTSCLIPLWGSLLKGLVSNAWIDLLAWMTSCTWAK